MAIVEMPTAAEPKLDDRVCRNCEFYHMQLSECRFKSPVIVMVPRGTNHDGSQRLTPVSQWPTTRPDDWCGDFDWRKR